jgi:hypothetical protein
MLGQAEKYMKVMTGFGSAAKRIQVGKVKSAG